MNEVEQLLRETMGLDAASIGSNTIQRSVLFRMKVVGVNAVEDYCQMLATSSTEWNLLVEAVIVTETWFFRDREAFAALIRLVLKEWLPENPTGVLRVLSLPCSSGEEPYSLVMALLDAGIPAQRFHVDGVDISAQALARARQGIYGKNSFRGTDLAFRDEYFQSTPGGYVLNPWVRNCVHFFEANLLANGFMAGKGNYDYIFCRNLLIYFDRPTQRKALQQIERLLTPSGCLFVGPAEQPLVLRHGFVSANIPMAFACRKPRPFSPVAPSPFPSRHNLEGANPSSTAATGLSNVELAGGVNDQLDLGLARRLADAGRFREASAICEAHLLAHGASAQAYFLLGLVHDASDHVSARDYYRKALYLDPNHYDTLLQMAGLSQKNGDLVRALTFRNRALRLKARKGEA
jgi:chemotaxis protein methyltransferase WspC